MAAGGVSDEAITTTQASSSPLFLGIDLSTQSITVVFVEAGGRVVHLDTLNFDRDLAQFGTVAGMHVGKHGQVTSPVQMWLEGLDRVLRRQDRALMARVKAVSGSAQQHGSVFWNADGLQALRNMAPVDSFSANLFDGFALEDCPIWADSSTTAECEAIEQAVGGPAKMAAVTGSRAYCRFTGPQIAKISRTQPLVWKHTARVSLVSSFLTSLLVGHPAPVDASDASGMNLMNVHTLEWSEELLEATAPGLAARLGTITKSWASAGPISPYCAARFGFAADCLVIPATGDNNCSVVGMGLAFDTASSTLMVSLGTSDTLVGLTRTPHPGTEGHVMVSPRGPEEWFAMLCYKNGALARKAVRDAVAGGEWKKFSELVAEAPAGNDGCLGLTLVMEEIVPVLNVKGTFRVDGQGEPVGGFGDAAHEARAVVEARFLSMKAHAAQLGLSTSPTRILATGGGSTSKAVMQVLADVFNAPVLVADTSDAAAVGAALRAEHGLACRKQARWVDFVTSPPQGLKVVATPNAEAVAAYSPAMLKRFLAFERGVGMMQGQTQQQQA